jgi:hypothetical protein
LKPKEPPIAAFGKGDQHPIVGTTVQDYRNFLKDRASVKAVSGDGYNFEWNIESRPPTFLRTKGKQLPEPADSIEYEGLADNESPIAIWNITAGRLGKYRCTIKDVTVKDYKDLLAQGGHTHSSNNRGDKIHAEMERKTLEGPIEVIQVRCQQDWDPLCIILRKATGKYICSQRTDAFYNKEDCIKFMIELAENFCNDKILDDGSIKTVKYNRLKNMGVPLKLPSAKNVANIPEHEARVKAVRGKVRDEFQAATMKKRPAVQSTTFKPKLEKTKATSGTSKKAKTSGSSSGSNTSSSADKDDSGSSPSPSESDAAPAASKVQSKAKAKAAAAPKRKNKPSANAADDTEEEDEKEEEDEQGVKSTDLSEISPFKHELADDPDVEAPSMSMSERISFGVPLHFKMLAPQRGAGTFS